MEWIPKFSNSSGSAELIQLQISQKNSKINLTPNGFLLIGIENRIGLKYLLGARDDHTGVREMLCYSKEIAKGKFSKVYQKKLECLTHSISEYTAILKQAGFTQLKYIQPIQIINCLKRFSVLPTMLILVILIDLSVKRTG